MFVKDFQSKHLQNIVHKFCLSLKLTRLAYISLRCVNSQHNALHMKATGGLFYAYAMRRIDSRAIHIVTTYYMPLLFVLKKNGAKG